MVHKRRQNPNFLIGFVCIALSLVLFSISQAATVDKPGKNSVHLIELNDVSINPVTAEYIIQAVDRAASEDAECLIIRLDTPGGLLSSTRSIVKKILASEVPVVVYIAPSGAHAGSAGVFITYASHVAAMAPSTNIGAAHPVDLGGRKLEKKGDWEELRNLIDDLKAKKTEAPSVDYMEETTKEVTDETKEEINEESKKEPVSSDDDPMSSKILNDTTAFIRSIATERGRNVDWAVKSVTESDSITEREALEKNVIELIADSEEDLLKKLDGRQVTINGREVVLHTAEAHLERIPMDSRQKILNVFADPNIAYILMIIGFYALLFEVTHPGFGLPGVIGAIFLILSFYSMQTLPTNYAGLALIIAGMLMLAGEIFLPGFGILTLGGLISMVLGSLLLFESVDPVMRISISLIIGFALATAVFTGVILRMIVRAHRQKVSGGKEGIIGEIGEARSAFTPGKPGRVFVHGELWNARSTDNLHEGDEIIVEEINGLELKVRKYERSN